MTHNQHHAVIEPPVGDDTPLWQALNSVYHLPMLSAADEVGAFAFLDHTPANALTVAAHCRLALNPARAMLSLLCSLGFLTQRDGLFHLTNVTRTYLLPGSRYYWGDFLRMVREPIPSFSTTLKNLHDGVPITQQNSCDMWQAHEQDHARALSFTRGMHSHSMAPAHAVARQGDFSGIRRLLDIGGASGCFCIEIARRYPYIDCSVYDLPFVCDLARQYVQQAGLSERINVLPGDMFKDAWPAGYDAVFFSNIFHDWDAQHCQRLVDKSFDYLPSGGRLYIHEMLLDDDQTSPTAAIGYSVDMALYTGGKQYSAEELQAMLTHACFTNITFTHTHGYFWLVTGQR